MIKIICDKCGKEISGKVYRMVMNEVQKEGPHSMDDLTGEELMEDELRKIHLCEDCSREIIRTVTG